VGQGDAVIKHPLTRTPPDAAHGSARHRRRQRHPAQHSKEQLDPLARPQSSDEAGQPHKSVSRDAHGIALPQTRLLRTFGTAFALAAAKIADRNIRHPRRPRAVPNNKDKGSSGYAGTRKSARAEVA
jgi:hypothetical protein